MQLLINDLRQFQCYSSELKNHWYYIDNISISAEYQGNTYHFFLLNHLHRDFFQSTLLIERKYHVVINLS